MNNKRKKDVDTDDSQNKKHNLFKTIVIVLLLIIIILLLLRGCVYSKTNDLVPTGDFDVFEINLEDCPVCEKCNTTTSNDYNSQNNTDKYANETGLIVYDNDELWDNSYVANIFTHASYDIVSGKIAPGSSNTYKFIVRNNNNFAVDYKISFAEVNTKAISMKYRLRKDSTYLIGSSTHWVDATSLAIGLTHLNSKGLDTYYLDWKWFDDDTRDASIGVDVSANYSLKIKVDAEQS